MDDIAATIKEQLAQKRITREALADAAKISASQLNKILSGERAASFQHLVRIGNVLEIDLISTQGQISLPQIAPDDFGAYTRAAVRWMEGTYLAVRHSFNRDDNLLAYVIRVAWDEESAILRFVSSDDFSGPSLQRGPISFSMRTGHSYLVTSDLGRFDLTILGQPAEEGLLFGLCTTAFMHLGRPTPASSAIALVPVNLESDLPVCGPIDREDAVHSKYFVWLRSAEENGFARLATSTARASEVKTVEIAAPLAGN